MYRRAPLKRDTLRFFLNFFLYIKRGNKDYLRSISKHGLELALLHLFLEKGKKEKREKKKNTLE